jgi:toluene monooxygenase system protein E
MADEEKLPLPTFSHLEPAPRPPTEYEVVSVGLHYHTRHPDSPWEMDPDLFMNRWYRRHREGGALRHPDWDAFRDPDALIYRSYIRLQNEQESYLDALLNEYSERRHDAGLSPAWVAALARFYTPARYGRHARQMAPASTISNCFFFQAADEARLMQRIAYRTAELRKHRDGHRFGAQEREAWENDPVWQGFRELLENALVAWDWGECFVALNLVAKPAFDEATLRMMSQAASNSGDELLHQLCLSHRGDVTRSRRWTGALLAHLAETSHNRAVVASWLERWVPLADKALRSYFRGLPGLEDEPAAVEARAACRAYRTNLGFA